MKSDSIRENSKIENLSLSVSDVSKFEFDLELYENIRDGYKYQHNFIQISKSIEIPKDCSNFDPFEEVRVLIKAL